MVERSVTTSGPLAPDRGWSTCSARKLLPVPVSPSISTRSGLRARTATCRRSPALDPAQVLGLRERAVEVEGHHVGERRLLPQRLRRLIGVVGALEGAALVPFFADLARMPPPAARDVIELREVPVAHLDRLVAVVD